MQLEILPYEISVCRIRDPEKVDLKGAFYSLTRTDRELSLVCPTRNVPCGTEAREDGWRAFRVRGSLDFSLTGILAGLSGTLAAEKIPLFAVSTFETDLILVRTADTERAIKATRRINRF